MKSQLGMEAKNGEEIDNVMFILISVEVVKVIMDNNYLNFIEKFLGRRVCKILFYMHGRHSKMCVVPIS